MKAEFYNQPYFSLKNKELTFAISSGVFWLLGVLFSIIISLDMVVLLVPMTLMGMIAIGPAVIGHEGSTVLVVLNAMRLLK